MRIWINPSKITYLTLQGIMKIPSHRNPILLVIKVSLIRTLHTLRFKRFMMAKIMNPKKEVFLT